MKITISKSMVSQSIYLYCSNCGINTLHVLTKSRNAYICGCGASIEIEYYEEEE